MGGEAPEASRKRASPSRPTVAMLGEMRQIRTPLATPPFPVARTGALGLGGAGLGVLNWWMERRNVELPDWVVDGIGVIGLLMVLAAMWLAARWSFQWLQSKRTPLTPRTSERVAPTFVVRAPIASPRPAIQIATPKGRVTFDSSTHDGVVTVGPAGTQMAFSFSLASRQVVHVRRCPGTVAVARAKNVATGDMVDFNSLDSTSHSYRVSVGELFLAKSKAGHFAQARIVSLMCEGHGDDRDEVVFDYQIQDSPQFIAV